MNKQRGSFSTYGRAVRSVNRLPKEIWHSRDMRVEEKCAGSGDTGTCQAIDTQPG